jgi:hypothetical protein
MKKINNLNIDKIYYKCPKCGWIPKSKIWGKISLSVYNQKHKKRSVIHCEFELCDFCGILEDFICFINE